MPLIRPFAGLRPRAEFAAQVLAPPYDVVTTDEARARAAGKPWSFLHISRPEIDLAPGTDPYDASVYRKGRENFDKQIAAGVLQRDRTPCYYLYRLVMGQHTQTGLVAAASVAAYDSQRIRRHEHTRPDKEDDRVRQIDALNAQTGPVFLTYRHDAGVDRIVRDATRSSPEVDVVADGPSLSGTAVCSVVLQLAMKTICERPTRAKTIMAVQNRLISASVSVRAEEATAAAMSKISAF